MKPQLNVLRRSIRAVMTARCRIVSLGRPVWDPDQGKTVRPEVLHYEGPCWVRPREQTVRTDTAGGQLLELTHYDVWLPAEVAPPADMADLYFTDSLGDAALPATKMAVVSASLDDWQTARRLVCQRVE